MAKILRQKKSNRGIAKCSKCNQLIKTGETYLKGIRYMCKPIIRCVKCGFDEYELSSSIYERSIYNIKNCWNEVKLYIEINELESHLNYMINSLSNLQNELQFSYDNLPDQFKDSHIVSIRLENVTNCLEALEDIDIEYDEDDEEGINNDAQKWDITIKIDDALSCL